MALLYIKKDVLKRNTIKSEIEKKKTIRSDQRIFFL